MLSSLGEMHGCLPPSEAFLNNTITFPKLTNLLLLVFFGITIYQDLACILLSSYTRMYALCEEGPFLFIHCIEQCLTHSLCSTNT